MRPLPAKAQRHGLTLIELLVVIAVLAILAAMLLPAYTDRGHKGGTMVRCMSNQKQIAIGFIMWNDDNTNQFPWQVSSTNGGNVEAASRGYAAGNFRSLSAYIRTPSLFICPTDTNRTSATNVLQIKNQNVSYFVAIDSSTNASASILTGDRHLANGGSPLKPGLFCHSNSASMSWTRELHGIGQNTLGVLSFYDGHAEVAKSQNLNSVFLRANLATNRLAVP